jgi:hypothetical protein
MSMEQESAGSESGASSAPVEGVHKASVSRRSLLRAGLGASPVILTVASRPVMATTGKCSSASAFGSINASRPSKVDYCGGCKPEYWKQPTCHPQWPTGYYPVSRARSGVTTYATKFNDCFGTTAGYPGKTLLEVMNLTATGGKDEVARLCSAALLNAVKGLTPGTVLSTVTVKQVWKSYVTKGYYEPNAGVRWYPTYSAPAGTGGLITWLKSTMPVGYP